MDRLNEWPNINRGRRRIYDYDKLLGGGIYQCKRGVDFTCKRNSFMTTMRKEAQARGLSFRYVNLDDEDTIVIQAYPPHSAS